ncbi:hypothetical protein Pint_24947 [Pistacia integerrima]|uniref:Uncharacterized protein n=1 Tax=Pistacia integerrima TaxID=434235 RepID=A0ACC0YCF9_9ROSI|nr:hypothetical protein Pint_24947 [Pistacia integerrima]
MPLDSGSSHFTDLNSSDTDDNTEDLGKAMVLKAFPLGVVQVANNANGVDENESGNEPYVGLEFDSADDAREFYSQYAARVGFKIRIGQLYRSRTDGSVSSRRYVCAKEGFQLNSRTGCPAFIRVQKRDSGKWVLDQVQKDHNHDLGSADENCSPIVQQRNPAVVKSSVNTSQRTKIISFGKVDKGRPCSSGVISVKRLRKGGDEGECIAEPYSGLEFNSANEAYLFYQAYARFTGFRIRIGQLFRSKNDGSITSRRFVCSKEGFQHPSRVGCGAFMRIKRHDSGSWIVDRLEKNHNHDLDGRIETSKKISASSLKFIDEVSDGLDSVDLAEINNSIFGKASHENNIGSDCWVPLYLRGTFFAGIPIGENIESFFGTTLTGQTPLREFISRYNQGLEKRREQERKEDFNTLNLQAILQTKEPMEEQCRRLYTLAVFRIFQNELLQSYSYFGIKTYEEGSIVRYLVRKCGNENEKHVVTFSPLNVSCSCQMFEFEGMLCRHILKVLNLLDIKEIPSQYILHRWTRNAVYGIVSDVESRVSFQELRAIMLWSLRETACKYIESGTGSLEKYKLAYEIMREGGNKLCWQR